MTSECFHSSYCVPMCVSMCPVCVMLADWGWMVAPWMIAPSFHMEIFSTHQWESCSFNRNVAPQRWKRYLRPGSEICNSIFTLIQVLSRVNLVFSFEYQLYFKVNIWSLLRLYPKRQIFKIQYAKVCLSSPGLEEFEEKIDKIAEGEDDGENSWISKIYNQFSFFNDGENSLEENDMDGLEPPLLDETWGLGVRTGGKGEFKNILEPKKFFNPLQCMFWNPFFTA